jgi:hypothetical protein
VKSCELPDGIQLVYADDRDRQRTISLEEAALLDFGRMKPFRTPRAPPRRCSPIRRAS